MKTLVSIINLILFFSSSFMFPQDGTLDLTFEGNGTLQTPFGNYSGARDAVILPDGKIVVVGVYQTVLYTTNLICLVKYNSDGSIDQSFGNNGIVTTDISGNAIVETILLQPDGKILAGGTAWSISNGNFLFVRYNSDGSLDNSFGFNGIVTKNFHYYSPLKQNGYSTDIFGEMRLQSDGKIVAAGSVGKYLNDTTYFYHSALLRLNSDGNLDDTFGNGGIFMDLINTNNAYINCMDLQPDGKIVLGGYQWYIPTAQTFITLRYNLDGTRDNSFSDDGIFMPYLGRYIEAVKVQPDGKILVAGSDNFPTIHRYTIDGTLDTTFNGWGVMVLPNSWEPGRFRDLEIQKDGKIIAVGNTLYYPPPHPYTDNVVARLNSNGIMDATFGVYNTGVVFTADFDGTPGTNYFVVIQPDNKIVFGGQAGNINGGGGAFVVARLNVNPIQNTYSTSFTVGNGWNLVSFPGIQPNSMLADTLFRFRDLLTSVFSFSSSGYNPEDTLKNGIGYWLKHNGQYTYNWNGTVQSGVLYPQLNYAEVDSFDGNSGWNVIGAYDYEFLTSELVTNPPGLINGVLYEYNAGFGYQPAVTLQPGKGYYVNLTGNGKIIYPDRPTSSPKLADENIIEKDWAKITITDAEGKQYTLYSTSDDGELDKYLLPPKPPMGMFDVRYTTDRFVDDISSEKVIDITGAEYPIRLKANGMDIKLKDAITGKIFNAMIKDGDEIVIDNSALDKLLIWSDGDTPIQYELAQNYPNPFNPSTTIRFSLPTESQVNLSIFNILGEKVSELKNEVMKPGYYTVEFDASTLASGIYIYRIQAESFIQSKKMILMK